MMLRRTLAEVLTFKQASAQFVAHSRHSPCACSCSRAILRQDRVVHRSFSTSSSFQATVVSKNPRKDEDGKDMLIKISDRAAKRLKQITSAPPQKNTLVPSSNSTPDSHLRITVTSGGCHGFQYMMSLEGSNKVDPEEDTVFTFEGDVGKDGNANVVLDEPSLELLKGSTVDFTTELIGSQFKIVDNPRATSNCGCGTSFDIE